MKGGRNKNLHGSESGELPSLFRWIIDSNVKKREVFTMCKFSFFAGESSLCHHTKVFEAQNEEEESMNRQKDATPFHIPAKFVTQQ